MSNEMLFACKCTSSVINEDDILSHHKIIICLLAYATWLGHAQQNPICFQTLHSIIWILTTWVDNVSPSQRSYQVRFLHSLHSMVKHVTHVTPSISNRIICWCFQSMQSTKICSLYGFSLWQRFHQSSQQTDSVELHWLWSPCSKKLSFKRTWLGRRLLVFCFYRTSCNSFFLPAKKEVLMIQIKSSLHDCR